MGYNAIKDIVTHCPRCKILHLDEDEWYDRKHKTHLCLNCGETWRPFNYPTRGVRPMWTLDEVRTLLGNLEKFAEETGWHFALAGGVLREGHSAHDLDLIAYPRTSTNSDRHMLRFLLTRVGWTLRVPAKEMHGHWKAKGSKDRKHVEVWRTGNGRRVDLFILGDNPGWFGTK
jgi:hypothetical protein